MVWDPNLVGKLAKNYRLEKHRTKHIFLVYSDHIYWNLHPSRCLQRVCWKTIKVSVISWLGGDALFKKNRLAARDCEWALLWHRRQQTDLISCSDRKGKWLMTVRVLLSSSVSNGHPAHLPFPFSWLLLHKNADPEPWRQAGTQTDGAEYVRTPLMFWCCK